MPDVMPFVTPEGGYGLNSVFLPVVTKTAAYTAVGGDQIILADATAGAFSVGLPAAADSLKQGRGDSFTVIKIDSGGNAVTIDPNASETTNGASTKVLSVQWARLAVRSDGTNWIIEEGGGNLPQAAEADPAALTAATLTDTSGGTANTTVQAIGGSFSQSEIANNFADLAAQHNAVVVDLGVLRTKIVNILTKLENAGIITP